MKTIYILDGSEAPAGISTPEIEQAVAAQLGRGVILLTDSPSTLLDDLELPGNVSEFAESRSESRTSDGCRRSESA